MKFDAFFLIASLFAILAFSVPAAAGLRLNGLFCDGMVLQRGISLPVFGWADPGEEIMVELAGQVKTARVQPDGTFRVYLEPLVAGGPHELKVTGHKSVVIRDVCIGEVWIASGQSNMDMQVEKLR